MKRFTHRNEGFVCAYCGQTVPPAQQTCRNHCTECLCSRHVDVQPGDRASACDGQMTPESVEFKGGLPAVIVHKCVKCGFLGKNKIADDDNRESLAKIMENRAKL